MRQTCVYQHDADTRDCIDSVWRYTAQGNGMKKVRQKYSGNHRPREMVLLTSLSTKLYFFHLELPFPRLGVI